MPTAHFRVRNFIPHWSNNMSIMKEGIRGGQRRSGCRVKLLDINQNNNKETAENNGGSQRKKGQRGSGNWANMGFAGEWGKCQEEERCWIGWTSGTSSQSNWVTLEAPEGASLEKRAEPVRHLWVYCLERRAGPSVSRPHSRSQSSLCNKGQDQDKSRA